LQPRGNSTFQEADNEVKWDRCILVVAVLASVVASAPTRASAAPKSPVVATDNGPVRGVAIGDMQAFLGIPYAAAPIGDLRWRPPQEHAGWRGVLDASAFGPHCPQVATPYGSPSTTEDCLFLNVFIPDKTNDGRPRILGDLGGPDAFEQTGFSRERPQDVWINVALGPAGTAGVRPWRPVPNDTLDVSPRLGFSSDVFGNGKAAVRASYGIYHDRITSLSLRGTVSGYNGLNIQSVEVANPTFFPRVPDAASLPTASIAIGAVPSPDGDTPYTQQSNAGFTYAPSHNTVVSADFTHILGLNFQMIRNANAPLPLAVTGGTRVCPFQTALVAKGLPGCFQMQIQNDQSNRIHVNAVSMRLERRFSKRLGFLLGYTLGSVKTVVDRNIR
jgi:hypothetical protein